MQFNLSKVLPHVVALVVFVLFSSLYFMPQFQGKKIQQGDILSWKGMSQEVVEYKKETGHKSMWTNSMFGGMPAYQILTPQKNNVFASIYKGLTLGLDRPAGMFVIGLISTYILLLTLGLNGWIAILFSICIAFTTNNLILFEAGHATKIKALMAAPLVIAGVVTAYRRSIWLGGALFGLGMGLQFFANHYQMTYYLAMCLSIFVILQLIDDVKKGKVVDFVKASAMLLVITAFAFGTSSAGLLTTYEYSKDTMRGEPILKQNTDEKSSSAVKGLSYDYAMQWSNGGRDLLASFVPMAVGGGSSELVTDKSKFGKSLKKLGVNMRKGIPLNTYWGALPFTSGPIYFGAALFFLFLLGAVIYPGSVKWWLVVSVVLTLLLSLGKNLGGLNEFIFNYVPFYNKFRTPNSILSITAIILPVLSVLALVKLTKTEDKSSLIKPLLITGGIFGGFLLILALLGSSIFDFSNPSDARYAQMGMNVSMLENHRESMLLQSSLRSFVFVALTVLLAFLYLKEKLSATLMCVSIGLICLVDILSVDLRYVNHSSFVPDRQYKQYFTPRKVDTKILEDSDPHYRVLDLTINTFNSSQSSYFHKTIGGYHAAKLQRYQDIIDRHISKNNQKVIDMLNTKYVITKGAANEEIARINPSSLGNAWFVNTVNYVPTADAEIDALDSFDPRGEAIVHQEFKSQLSSTQFDKNGSITLTSYAPDKLTYKSSSSTPQLAVFSEVWYGPDKGWKLYVDGEEKPLIRANYILRAAQVPAGDHSIEMVFDPETKKRGDTIALVCSILLLLVVVAGLFFYVKNKNRD